MARYSLRRLSTRICGCIIDDPNFRFPGTRHCGTLYSDQCQELYPLITRCGAAYACVSVALLTIVSEVLRESLGSQLVLE